jgi:hypothetical protein
MTLYYVSAAANDYYVNSSTGAITGTTLLRAEYNNFLIPNYDNQSYGLIDCSGVGTDVISAATFKFNSGAYTYVGRPAPTKIYNVWIFNGSSYVIMANGANVVWSKGENSVVLSAAELAFIGNIGGSTIFRITVTDPGVNKSRYMNINAYETSQATAMRLDITHAPATNHTQVINMMS